MVRLFHMHRTTSITGPDLQVQTQGAPEKSLKLGKNIW